MNGNNKSTASRLCYCIYLVGKVTFPSKTQALSTKEVTTSTETNTNLFGLKMNIKRNVESYPVKLEYIQKSCIWRLTCWLSFWYYVLHK